MQIPIPSSDLDTIAVSCQQNIEALFSEYVTRIPAYTLKNAIKYVLDNGGKRLRPLLIFVTGQIFSAPIQNLTMIAASVELIHTYSLIHDDLPCMDNADLRRGKATCHKIFGEGMAVLTGDALHTLAMQIIASHPAPLSGEKRLAMMQVLTEACGPFGMAAGQALDLTELKEDNISITTLDEINQLKTGALIRACLTLGWLASHDDDEKNKIALENFGRLIGLAFQIQDDILDKLSSTQQLGKPQGIDAKNHKKTYPELYGLKIAQEKVIDLYQSALEMINYLGTPAENLRHLVRKMLERKN